MKTLRDLTVLFVTVGFTIAIAATPQLVNYQGRLIDIGGNPVDSLISITFTIYDAPTGGNAVWQETHQEVDVQSGLFSVMLGSQVGLTDTVFADSSRWLAISLGSDPEATGRTRMSATPYAMRVATVDGGAGGTIRSDLRVEGLTTAEAIEVRKSSSSLGVVGLNWYKDNPNPTNPCVTLSNDSASNDWAILALDSNILSIRSRHADGTVSVYGYDNYKANLVVDGYTTSDSLESTRIVSRRSGGSVSINTYENIDVPSITIENSDAECQWVIKQHDDKNLYIGIRENSSGSVHIAANSGYEADLNVHGQTTTKVLEITGGSDLAEPFDISDGHAVQPGSVVVIDENNPGRLTVSTTPYDRRVAGVISGAGGIKPGLTLKQEGLVEGAHNVTLSGRVYVLACVENGPILPGDRLTASSIPGHCMKATDSRKWDGAVIGKAMTGLAEGTGLVLALISLQ